MSRLSAGWIGRRLRRARSRFVRGGVVLGYHRVAKGGGDALGQTVSPEHFAEQLEVVRRIATPVPLHELARAVRDEAVIRRTVAVTFDDGYEDNLRAAKPVLARVGIPATVYVVSGWLGRHFWWDELAARVTDRRRLLRAYRRLMRAPHEAGGRLDREAPAPDGAYAGPAPRAMTAEEVVELAADGLVSIGAHSVTHPRLTALAPDEQRREIRGSKEQLQELLGRSVETFAYPWGAANEVTRRLVGEAGFAWACGGLNDVVSGSSDPYALPRVWVPDVDGDRFARWLAGWLGAERGARG